VNRGTKLGRFRHLIGPCLHGLLCLCVVPAAVLTAAPISTAQTTATQAMDDHLVSREERTRFFLAQYKVRDPHASYFDIDARREILQNRNNHSLFSWAEQITDDLSCHSASIVPVIDWKVEVPGFYPEPDRWQEAMAVFIAAETAFAKVTTAWVVHGDPYYAECLIDVYERWSQHDALLDFFYSVDNAQAWFAVEGTLAAIALSYSTISSYAVAHRPDAANRIVQWLAAAAAHHLSIDGGNSSCCNNHFYGRGVYAAMIGVIAESNELLRVGVSTIYSALKEMRASGILPREMVRGPRAWHYQNYAMAHLVVTAQIIERQGYAIYELSIDGKTLKMGVDILENALRDRDIFEDITGDVQYTAFLDDPQYLAWVEIYLTHHEAPTLRRLVQRKRPLFRRISGGPLTLFFMHPGEAQEDRWRTIDGMLVQDAAQCASHPRWRAQRDTRWRYACEQSFSSDDRRPPLNAHAVAD